MPAFNSRLKREVTGRTRISNALTLLFYTDGSLSLESSVSSVNVMSHYEIVRVHAALGEFIKEQARKEENHLYKLAVQDEQGLRAFADAVVEDEEHAAYREHAVRPKAEEY